MSTQTIYRERRATLAKTVTLPMVFTAHHAMQARADMSYPFVQEATFLYLTGINDAQWKLLFDGVEWCLVKPKVSDVKAIFDGSLSASEATKLSGVELIISEKEYQACLQSLLQKQSTIATLGPDPMEKYYDFVVNPAQKKLDASVKRLGFSLESCRTQIKKQRAIKSPEEIAVIRKAVAITVDTFASVKEQLTDFSSENEIEAVFNGAFRSAGAEGHAYDPIVASGAHACTLHYSVNQALLPKNGLVLLDIGASVDGYAADITRTYALGRVSDREKAVHAAVEQAHGDLLKFICPGLLFSDYEKQVESVMKKALKSLSLLDDETDMKTYRKYFPHAIGHGLGLDVHESLGGFESFQEGMVLTVEPGIYIPEEEIGVRIEDDVLVTANGVEVLSAHLPTSL